MTITDSIYSFHAAKSSVSNTDDSTENRSMICLNGKSYHLKIYYKKPNSDWEEITQNYLKLSRKSDFQSLLQQKINVPCEKIEIITSISPDVNSHCKIQEGGIIRKIPFILTGAQSTKIFAILGKIKNLKSREQSKKSILNLGYSLSQKNLDKFSSIKMSLEESKKDRVKTYLQQVVTFTNKPVGFKNVSMNCGFNSCLQMIVNEPALLSIYTTVASYYAKKTKTEDQMCGYRMLSILNAYNQAKEEQKPISKEVSNNLRLAMHYLRPKEIRQEASSQEDAHEILAILFAKYDHIIEEKHSENASSINYSFEHITHYQPKQALKETPHKDCSALHPDNTYRKKRTNYGIKINLDEKQKHFKLSSLLEKYFCDEEIGIGSETRRYLVNNIYTEVSPIKEEIKLNSLPEDLFIHFSRFKKDQTKLTAPIEIPEKLDARLLTVVQGSSSGSYELSSFIVHGGRNLNYGHYIAYRKVQDQWMKCNDASVSYITKEEMLKAAKDSYICFYRLSLASTDKYLKNNSCDM
ncbi:MAG: hypothetical protein QG627_305 [Chlamydiota bacterium]|nr:hypothetical protein [Chlamydiota bacterium]